MNTKLNDLKAELREFIELSKMITQGKWSAHEDSDPSFYLHAEGTIGFLTCQCTQPDATFIARSRNLSPAMAECLLGVVEWLELYAIPTDEANKQLQQILNIWEAAK